MRNYLALKLSLSDDIENFVVKFRGGEYDLLPNDKTILKLSVNYRFISFSIKESPKFFPGNDDDDIRGSTKYQGYSLSFSFDHWLQSLSYSKATGYYLNNTKDYNPNWKDGDPYYQFPELEYKGFHGRTAYKFNGNFSFNALSTQTERQLKSAGTFMPVLVYNYYIIDNKIALTGQNSSQKSNNFELSLLVGYFYTFVLKKNFYFSVGASPGIGFTNTKLLTRLPSGDNTSYYTDPIFRFDLGLAFGYNGERFFAGTQLMGASADNYRNNTSSAIINNVVSYQLFFGYRFNAPKFLIKLTDKTTTTTKGIIK